MLKLRAKYDWAECCWKEGDIFECHEQDGKAYILCHDTEHGPHHWVDNGGEDDLSIADILAGKSDQFDVLEKANARHNPHSIPPRYQ